MYIVTQYILESHAPLSSGKSRSFRSKRKSHRPTSGMAISGYVDLDGMVSVR